MAAELAYWATVALVAVVGVAAFKLLAAGIGDRVPGLPEFAAFI